MITKILIGAMFALIIASSWALAQTRLTNTEKGYRTYQRNCFHCHGAALDGKGPDAASLRVPPPNFHTYLSRLKDDAEFESTIARLPR